MKTKIFTETASETQPKHRGWPKGKPRGPRKPQTIAAEAITPKSAQWLVFVAQENGAYLKAGVFASERDAVHAVNKLVRGEQRILPERIEVIEGHELELELALVPASPARNSTASAIAHAAPETGSEWAAT